MAAKKSKKQVTNSKVRWWEKIRFQQEKILSDRLSSMLHMDLLVPILAKGKYSSGKDYWRAVFEGQSFRLTPRLAPRLHEMCREVQTILQFDEPVEFFVSNDPSINAVAFLRDSTQHSHLILFNSGLIETFNDEELRFIIGHELGHIIFKTAELKRFIKQLYPEGSTIPLPINNLICLWDKFAEIAADRMGFIASPNLETCITIFFKLSSGLCLEKVDFDVKSYLAEIDTILEKFTESEAMSQSSHPTNPIRVKAIQLFSESLLYRNFVKSGKAGSDSRLSKKMEQLTRLLELHPDNERDYYRLLIVAAGGFLIAGIDRDFTVMEEDKILEYIANFTVYPRIYLQNLLGEIKEQKKLAQIVTGAIEKLVSIDPGERYPIFNYLVSIAVADRKLHKQEIEFIMDIATKVMGIHEIEASRLFIKALREEKFQPSLLIRP